MAIQDDAPLFIIRRDLSGGVNTRQHEQIIGESQSTVLENVVLDIAGQRSLRSGSTLIEDLGGSGKGLFGFMPENGTNYLIANNGSYYKWWAGSGSFLSIASLASIGFDLDTFMVKALESDVGDVVVFANGTDNAIRLDPVTPAFQDLGDTNTSPPKTTVMEYYRDRLWTLTDNKLSYSGAVPTDYSNTFSRSNNYYNIPVGTARKILGLRDTGLIMAGSDQIWGLNPAATPAPSTDKPEMILNMGVVNGNTMKMVADDIYFLASDGVRGLFRTQQDKIQAGQSKPLSWKLKDQFDNINFAQISKADAIYWDGKYFLSLPTGTSTYNDTIWVAYPDLRDEFGLPAWVVFTGLTISKFATLNVSGEERLYGIDAVNGKVYRLFYGTSDNGSALEYLEEGRGEDFGQPLKYKWGGEFKLKVAGGTGTVIVSANPDDTGYTQLGAVTLSPTGLTFPLTFPLDFGGDTEISEQFHLDPLGRFKRIKFKIYANTLNQQITILESIAVTFSDEYLSEE